MSGVDIAESMRPWNLSGGKVIGTRMIVDPMPRSPRSFQKGWLFLRFSTYGLDNGMRRLPILSTRRGGCTFAEANSGTYVLRLRFRKSKMLWRAGFTPAAKVDQATGDSAGKVVRSLW